MPRKIAIHTDGVAGSSFDNIKNDISTYLQSQGDDVVEDSKCTQLSGKSVLNIYIKDVMKLASIKKYVGYQKMTTLFAPNLYEFSDSELMGILYESCKNTMICYSPLSFNEITNFIRLYFAPQAAFKMLDNTKLIPYGIDFTKFNPAGKNDKNKWIVPYNRINNIQKNVKLHKEITDSFNTSCMALNGTQPEHLFIYHPKYVEGKDLSEFSNTYSMAIQGKREDYIEEIKEKGMFLSTSLTESFGLYYLELLASGVVGVFLDRPWIRMLLPEYPFIAKKQDLLATMMTVYNNYEDSHNRLINEIVPIIKERYNVSRFCMELGSYL